METLGSVRERVEGAVLLGTVLGGLRLNTQILCGPASLFLGIDHRDALKVPEAAVLSSGCVHLGGGEIEKMWQTPTMEHSGS